MTENTMYASLLTSPMQVDYIAPFVDGSTIISLYLVGSYKNLLHSNEALMNSYSSDLLY